MKPGGSVETLSLRRRIAADHPAFAGHFPGRPILPGVVLLNEVLQAIRSVAVMDDAIGAEPLLLAAKFVAPVEAACELQIGLRLDGASLAFEVAVGTIVVAKGQFQARRAAAGAQ